MQLIKPRAQFLQAVIILARDNANKNSNSLWAKLSIDIKLMIICFIGMTSEYSIEKTSQQIKACAQFIFDHMQELSVKLNEGYRFKIHEARSSKKFEFQFFKDSAYQGFSL